MAQCCNACQGTIAALRGCIRDAISEALNPPFLGLGSG
jgi:hypothetical protein